MAWNEPGGGKQRDPWKDGGGGGSSPDFEAALKRVGNFFNRLFGGGSGGGFAIAVFGIVIAWLVLDSWVLVKANESGVALRFGKFTRVLPPGFNLKWPRPIESVVKVDVKGVRATQDQVRMLTKDENIVLVDFNVQYQVDNPQQFLFSVRDPDETIKQAAESAVREVIGGSGLSSIMPDQLAKSDVDNKTAPMNPSAELALQAKDKLQETLGRYDAGLIVTQLNFQNVRPPQEVKEAFDDAISAREDRQRRSNDADAYAKSVIPTARGDAARILAEAEGYKAERIAKAQGDGERFNLIAAEYKLAPEVTRKRLYIETMQKVLGDSTKVIDLTGGKNVLYLPIDNGNPSSRQSVEAIAPTIGATPEPAKGGR
jgi:membrane protease subunit HflK